MFVCAYIYLHFTYMIHEMINTFSGRILCVEYHVCVYRPQEYTFILVLSELVCNPSTTQAHMMYRKTLKKLKREKPSSKTKSKPYMES